MTQKATLEVAYDILKTEHPLPFYELWEKVCASQTFTKEQCFNLLSRFYTNLTVDESDEDIEEKTLLLQAGEVTVDETGLKLDDEEEEETEQE
jgi:hypothetical protein